MQKRHPQRAKRGLGWRPFDVVCVVGLLPLYHGIPSTFSTRTWALAGQGLASGGHSRDLGVPDDLATPTLA